jgi:hypothetical protein
VARRDQKPRNEINETPHHINQRRRIANASGLGKRCRERHALQPRSQMGDAVAQKRPGEKQPNLLHLITSVMFEK